MQAENEEKGMPTLVLKDRKSKAIKAYDVTGNGVNDYVVRRVVKTIEELGHKRTIFKSDGESAIIDFNSELSTS